jgi:catechol 2,3-dioxygenase-like lactoylglutathione lyase family enzyme
VAARIDGPADPADSSPSPVDFDPVASPGDLEAADDADVPERRLREDASMSTTTPLARLPHLDLSVSNRHASAQWYADVLGFEIRGDRFNEAAQLPWVHLVHPCGLSIGLVEHPDNPGDLFDERRSGLDHLSFAVATREDVVELARRVTEAGRGAAAVSDTPQVAIVVLRDPDHIQIEVCFWKTQNPY